MNINTINQLAEDNLPFLPEYKICSVCQQNKPIKDYHWQRKDANTKASRCRVCTNTYQRKYRLESNPKILPVTRVCNNCQKEKDIGEFYWQNKELNIKTYQCIDCSKRQQAEYRKQKKKEGWNQKNVIVRNYLYILNYLSIHPCVDCGETDVRVLEFDHVRGEKVKAVSHMVNRKRPLIEIDNEIAKCDIRCRHCHHIKHFMEKSGPKAVAYRILMSG